HIHNPNVHSIPTRRSSDLERKAQAIHAYQKQVFELAIASLQRFSKDERDVSTVTFSVDDQAYQAILDILRECRRQVQKHADSIRSEEHTSELQSRFDLVCR